MPKLTKAELRSLAAFRYEIRKFVAFTESTAREAGLEPQQHQLLLAIVGLPRGLAPTIGTLAERLMLKHHSAVELIGRCVELGLVTTARSPDDRRVVLVTVTKAGRLRLDAVSALNRKQLSARRKALIDALSKIGC